jgi:zinc transport system ATP-binding protein
MSDAIPAFRITDGSVVLGGESVLRHVTLSVPRGEFLAILGGNGAGKSTLLRALLGLIPLESGQPEIWGEPADSFKNWQDIAYVPQQLTSTGAVPVSVQEVVSSGQFTPRRRGKRPAKAKVREALESVGLWSRRRESLHKLSGGQQRRVMIARALARGSDTFLLDEPTAGVDEENRERLHKTLEQLRDDGSTVLLVTHELTGIRDLATRCVVLGTDGPDSVTFAGPPPELQSVHDPEGHHIEPTAPRSAWELPL